MGVEFGGRVWEMAMGFETRQWGLRLAEGVLDLPRFTYLGSGLFGSIRIFLFFWGLIGYFEVYSGLLRSFGSIRVFWIYSGL